MQTFVDTTVILSPDDYSYVDEPHPEGETITVEPSVTGTELVFTYQVKSDGFTGSNVRPRRELWHVVPTKRTWRDKFAAQYREIQNLRDAPTHTVESPHNVPLFI